MILVDIYAPSVNQNYDFNLDENAKISLIIDEISSMICQKEQCELKGNVRELLLVSQRLESSLNPDNTLSYYNITPGDKLLLV